ncbi:MAG: DUF1080 domain-containing protein [Candidatus Hydrogenedentes bacterium]|nr:DUF1080 domain-containing protein [Candidatus Hydrogenedentota bacterium]
MLRVLCVLSILCAAMAPAFAGPASDVATQGIYEGSFSSGAWKGQPVVVQVVATGKARFRAVFPFDASTPRVGVNSAADGDKFVFEGEVDLGPAMGGKFEVSAELVDNRLTGRFKGPGKDSQFRAEKVEKTPPTLGKKPPEGAVVLLDGTNLDGWERTPPKWRLLGDGAMEVCGSNLVTKQEFGDCEMHIEFRTPFMPDSGPGTQGRGNSGVYIQGRYEIQVLDSFGVDPEWNLCGGIYQVAKPIADACLPPTEWQTYDISFTAPRFDDTGKKVKNAEITVLHNGIPIHQNLVLPSLTAGGVSGEEAPTGPIMLQDHGNSVRYRNVWLVPK